MNKSYSLRIKKRQQLHPGIIAGQDFIIYIMSDNHKLSEPIKRDQHKKRNQKITKSIFSMQYPLPPRCAVCVYNIYIHGTAGHLFRHID